jgi:hypothetical protein
MRLVEPVFLHPNLRLLQASRIRALHPDKLLHVILLDGKLPQMEPMAVDRGMSYAISTELQLSHTLSSFP